MCGIHIATEWQADSKADIDELVDAARAQGVQIFPIPSTDVGVNVMLVEVAAGQMPNLLRFFSSMDFMSEDLAKRVGLVGMRAVRSVKPTDAESFCDYLLEEINHLASSAGTLYQAQDSALQTVGGLSASMEDRKSVV